MILTLTLALGLSALLGGGPALAGVPQASPPGTERPLPSTLPPNPELQQLLEAARQALQKADLAAVEKALAAGLEKAQSLGDKHWTACFLNGLGNHFGMQRQFARASDYHTRALADAQACGDDPQTAWNLTCLGLDAFQQGQLPSAQDYYARALPVWEKLGYAPALADCLDSLGDVSFYLGQLDSATGFHLRARAIVEKGDPRRLAASLNRLSLDCDAQGLYDQGIAYVRQFLAIWEKLGDTAQIAWGLDSLGSLYNGQGVFDKALDSYTRALDLYRKASRIDGEARSLGSLGEVYNNLGQFDRAQDYATRALRLFEQLGDTPSIAKTFEVLGGIHLGQGHLEQARDDCLHAQTLFAQLGDPGDNAQNVVVLGRIYTALHQFDSAEACFTRVLQSAEPAGNLPLAAWCLSNLGYVYRAENQPEKALDVYQRGLALSEPLGNDRSSIEALSNLGAIYLDQGHYEQAQDAFDRAVRHYEHEVDLFGDPQQVGVYQEAAGTPYALYAALRVAQKRPAEALVLVERGRGRGLAGQAAQSRAGTAAFLVPADAAALQQGLEALTAADRMRNATNSRPLPEEAAARQALQTERDTARNRFEQAERRLTVLRADLYKRYPQFRRLQGADPPTEAQLRALADRHPDTLYLEWVVVNLKTSLLLTLTKRQGIQAFELPVGYDDLERQVPEWRAALLAPAETHPDRRARALKLAATEPQQARRLYQALLAPLERAGLLSAPRARPGIKPAYAHLVCVADGPLRDLPFAALLDGSGKRLIERYSLSTTISLGSLLWPSNPRRPTSTLFCAADPTGPGGGRLAGPIQAAALRGRDAPLPLARAEGKAVSRLFPKALILMGPQAREAEVKRQMGRYALLHFATHGELNAGEGLRSWLKLAPEPPASPENGLLEAREILNIPLSAQLAVLSACESGLGQKSGGEGLLGLAWAFLAAGCPSIVASQWNVDDAATRDLVVAFYEGLKAGKKKDAALCQAMRTVQKTPGHAAPYYWAAFQVIGDTSPIRLSLY